MSTRLTRRDFLQVTGVGAVATRSVKSQVSSLKAAERQASDLTLETSDLLFDRPMRWVQLTLVENDPGRFDPQFWLDYFRRLHADAATLSAGGIVAYYHLLTSGTSPRVEESGSVVTVTVPSVEVHEVVAIDL